MKLDYLDFLDKRAILDYPDNQVNLVFQVLKEKPAFQDYPDPKDRPVWRVHKANLVFPDHHQLH